MQISSVCLSRIIHQPSGEKNWLKKVGCPLVNETRSAHWFRHDIHRLSPGPNFNWRPTCNWYMSQTESEGLLIRTANRSGRIYSVESRVSNCRNTASNWQPVVSVVIYNIIGYIGYILYTYVIYIICIVYIIYAIHIILYVP